MLRKSDLESREKNQGASFAVFSADCARDFPENRDELRTALQRDRARIIHSKSFRRLKGKTQVFVASHGDHYRNRLTHTLEVAQIARDLARNLAVNEDLAECIALAHDLGHTPFGHVGEQQLDELLRPHGAGFEHNRQSHRLLTVLEKKYPDFDGLNLTTAVLDGLAKHQTAFDQPGERLSSPSLEAQLVDRADEIAYTAHDLDDGLRAGILKLRDLRELPIWQRAEEKVDTTLTGEAFAHRAVSAVIDELTCDLLENTTTNLEKFQIQTLADIRSRENRLAVFSPKLAKEHGQLRSFLFRNFYQSSEVVERSAAGAAVIEQLFAGILADPELLPPEFQTHRKKHPLPTVVADFISGMTDDYAGQFLGKISKK